MRLGGLATCPYCRHKEEREVDISGIFACGNCNKEYRAIIRIDVVTIPLLGREENADRKISECAGKG